MPIIIDIGNEKGGILKTTTCLHLADRMHKIHGYSVALIDLDTQNSIQGFYEVSKPNIEKRCDYHIAGSTTLFFKEDAELPQLKKDKINIFTGGPLLSDFDKINLKQAIDRFSRVKELDVDVVIIDLPPTTSNKVIAAIANADGVFIPTDFSRMANQGVTDIYNKIKAVRQNQGIRSTVVPLGIIPTVIDGRDKDQKQSFISFLKKNGKDLILQNIIALRPKIRNCIDNHQLIWEIKSGDPRIPKKEMITVIDEMHNKILALMEAKI